MRSDEAVVVSSAPSTLKTWTPTQLGFNGASVSAGAGSTGTFVNVAGYRKLAVVITCTQPYELKMLAKIGGTTANGSLWANGVDTTVTGTGGVHQTLVIDGCFDEAAVYVKNTGVSGATVTCAMAGLA